ncbi:Microtubule-actin cross-linking factor 1 [Liparis tanakae]|uniref:Microtubule-actin cross-linking factor 1 n=1 Tax=Liparis tanakae TaxID=230148 RepID=A0A4Z2F1J7_9TELE|nr:Microtubule-actin cross-linking factor 1 [Liparis tanakae]
MATRKEGRGDQLPPVAEGSRGERNGAPPCPGDTLPWNLSKHQRVKRAKSSTGEVLDPADRAVIRIAGMLDLTVSFGILLMSRRETDRQGDELCFTDPLDSLSMKDVI